MADVFISYKREDAPRVRVLAQRLEEAGYTVWWDLQLVVGQRYDRKIKEELDAAKAIVVVWSANSVAENRTYASQWVGAEADEGAARGVLAPVLMDEGRVAWTHKSLHYADLCGWDGATDHPGFQSLLVGLEPLAGAPVAPSADDLQRWDAAKAGQKAEAFERFAREHPASRFADVARDRAAELLESEAFASLDEAADANAIERFIARFPTGRFAHDARERLASLAAKLPRSEPVRLSATPTPGLRLEWLSAGPVDPALLRLVQSRLSAAGHRIVETALADRDTDALLVLPPAVPVAPEADHVLTLHARQAETPILSLDHAVPAGYADDTFASVDDLAAGLARRQVWSRDLRRTGTGRIVIFWGDDDHRRFDLPEQIRGQGLYGAFVAPSSLTLCAPPRAGSTRRGAFETLARTAASPSTRAALSAELKRARAAFVLLSDRFCTAPPQEAELLGALPSSKIVFVLTPPPETEDETPPPAPSPPRWLDRPGVRRVRRAVFRDQTFQALLRSREELDWLDAYVA